MSESEIEVFVPVAAARVTQQPLAPRADSLDGARVAFFDNSKANAAALLAGLAGQYPAHNLALAKDATRAAPAEVMAHLKSCDAVVLAIAD